MSSRAPLIVAIVLLLLPGLYVVSYLALVTPQTVMVAPSGVLITSNYRVGHRAAPVVFLPLELIDRKLRPQVWRPLVHNWLSMPPLRNPVPDEDVPIIRDELNKDNTQPESEVDP